MAGNYANLLATIASNVYTNHNNEVTAAQVKAALDGIVSSLTAGGYLWKGIATPTSPGSAQAPDERVFYLATTAGTYTYLGGLVVNAGEAAILYWDTAWHKVNTGIPLVSVSQNTSTGHTDITVGGVTIPVASVEDVNNLRTIDGKNGGFLTLPITTRYDGKRINADGAVVDNSEVSIRVFALSSNTKIVVPKSLGGNPIGVFCSDATDVQNSRVGSVIPFTADLPLWLDAPSGASYIAINCIAEYEPNNVYAQVLAEPQHSQVHLEKEIATNTENVNNIVSEYENLAIAKSFPDTRLIKFNNRITYTTSSSTGYSVRAFDVENLAKVRIEKLVGGNIQGIFCGDVTTMADVIKSCVGGIIENAVSYPVWIDVPDNAKYLVVNSYPSYEPNNVYAQVLAKPFEPLNRLGKIVYGAIGTENLPIEKIYSDSIINNSGTIQTGQTGYVIRVFDVSDFDRVYIDKYIGTLNYCGVFCTDKDNIISTKIGDFVPKQTSPNWIDKPSTALYFAVNSYPSYEPNNIYAQVLATNSMQQLKQEFEGDINVIKNQEAKKNPFKCVQWNVGQFGHGSSSSTITPSNYNQMVVLWNKEVARQGADICGLIEYNPKFGTNPQNIDVSPDAVVWNNYFNNIVYRRSPTTSWYGGNAVISNLKVISSAKVKYECFEGVVGPDATTQMMLDEAFYTLVVAEYMGVQVKLLECMVPFNVTTPSDNTYQRMAYTELAETFANDDYVIMMGDFELVDNDDYDIFTNEGFTLANGGSFGWFPTCPDDYTLVQGVNALDNIIIRGFDIKSVRMSNSILSDHFPLIAELEII